jgi:uncharacterized protein YodC (DUF2158 family)
MSFEVGEVVKLKSGGANMTVTGISTSEDRPPSFNCAWLDKDNRQQVGSFPAEALVSAASGTKKTPPPLQTKANTKPPGDGTGWMSR